MTDRYNVNESIICTVKDCKNHSDSADFCALEEIRVGAQEEHPSDAGCTNCRSFVPESYNSFTE